MSVCLSVYLPICLTIYLECPEEKTYYLSYHLSYRISREAVLVDRQGGEPRTCPLLLKYKQCSHNNYHNVRGLCATPQGIPYLASIFDPKLTASSSRVVQIFEGLEAR
jgi:hypothetical protein